MGPRSRFFRKKNKKKCLKWKLRKSKKWLKWPKISYTWLKNYIFKKTQIGHCRGQNKAMNIRRKYKNLKFCKLRHLYTGLVWWKPQNWNQHTQKPTIRPLIHSFGQKKWLKIGVLRHWLGLVWQKPQKWNQHTQKPSNGPLAHSYRWRLVQNNFINMPPLE